MRQIEIGKTYVCRNGTKARVTGRTQMGTFTVEGVGTQRPALWSDVYVNGRSFGNSVNACEWDLMCAEKPPGLIATQRDSAAKAAAIMHYTTGVRDYKQALEIFTRLEDTLGPVCEVIDSYEGVEMLRTLDMQYDEEWFIAVDDLALQITMAYREEKSK